MRKFLSNIENYFMAFGFGLNDIYNRYQCHFKKVSGAFNLIPGRADYYNVYFGKFAWISPGS